MEQQIHGGNIYDKNIYNKEITLDYSVNINVALARGREGKAR